MNEAISYNMATIKEPQSQKQIITFHISTGPYRTIWPQRVVTSPVATILEQCCPLSGQHCTMWPHSWGHIVIRSLISLVLQDCCSFGTLLFQDCCYWGCSLSIHFYLLNTLCFLFHANIY